MDIFLLPSLALAFQVQVHSFEYNNVGYIPPKTEQIARGAGIIRCSGNKMSLWNPETEELVLFQNNEITASIPAPFTTDVLWSSLGHILVLHDALRTISLYNSNGVRLSTLPLPRLIPQGGQLVEMEGNIYSKDILEIFISSGQWI